MDDFVAEDNKNPDGYEPFPKLFPYDTFEQTVGPLLHKNEENTWSFKFLVQQRHLNPLGRLHGGMVMTFLDHTLGGTAFHAVGNKPCITVGLHTNFVAGAKAGDWVVGTATVNRITGNLVFLSGELRVNDKLIATAGGVWRSVEFGAS
ncbi:PaaI family thioesterase [Pseudomonas sp. BN415]|uniref:PaaI family thioesterase n=1 Tax=Pseudomonas sp. BN415 TaxID=2567889 RepID=UPI00245882C1|nr:PaaI family thioesterase [Pseudomonas sp. BN415]MDH4585581.1 PaaI family thioesterase [Pseudomonas sp. BN415]